MEFSHLGISGRFRRRILRCHCDRPFDEANGDDLALDLLSGILKKNYNV